MSSIMLKYRLRRVDSSWYLASKSSMVADCRLMISAVCFSLRSMSARSSRRLSSSSSSCAACSCSARNSSIAAFTSSTCAEAAIARASDAANFFFSSSISFPAASRARSGLLHCGHLQPRELLLEELRLLRRGARALSLRGCGLGEFLDLFGESGVAAAAAASGGSETTLGVGERCGEAFFLGGERLSFRGAIGGFFRGLLRGEELLVHGRALADHLVEFAVRLHENFCICEDTAPPVEAVACLENASSLAARASPGGGTWRRRNRSRRSRPPRRRWKPPMLSASACCTASS